MKRKKARENKKIMSKESVEQLRESEFFRKNSDLSEASERNLHDFLT